MKDYTEFPLEINAERLMQLPALARAMEEGISIVLYCKYGRISFDVAQARSVCRE